MTRGRAARPGPICRDGRIRRPARVSRGVELGGALAVLLLVLAGCGGNGGNGGSGTSTATTGAAEGASGASGAAAVKAAGQIGADHECVVGGTGRAPEVAWAQLRNPILSEPARG